MEREKILDLLKIARNKRIRVYSLWLGDCVLFFHLLRLKKSLEQKKLNKTELSRSASMFAASISIGYIHE